MQLPIDGTRYSEEYPNADRRQEMRGLHGQPGINHDSVINGFSEYMGLSKNKQRRVMSRSRPERELAKHECT